MDPMRLPPGSPATPAGLGWVAARTRCEGYPLSGLTPAAMPRRAHSGRTALMYAANHDHHEVVEKLVVACADLNTKNIDGCALPLGPSGGVVGAFVGRRLHLRRQGHSAAHCGAPRPHQIRRCAALRRRRPDHHEQARVTLCRPERRRRAAHRIGPNRRRRTPRQDAQHSNKLAAYDAAVAEVRPPASSTAPPSACAPCKPCCRTAESRAGT
jgi:hypothetical protein